MYTPPALHRFSRLFAIPVPVAAILGVSTLALGSGYYNIFAFWKPQAVATCNGVYSTIAVVQSKSAIAVTDTEGNTWNSLTSEINTNPARSSGYGKARRTRRTPT